MNTRHTLIRLSTSILFFLPLLFLLFLLSGRPVHASLTGQCGDNVYYSLSDDGTLTFTGSGPMWNYDAEDFNNPSPLHGNTDVRRAVIGYGITDVGDFMLQKCTNLTEVTFSETVTRIGICAFHVTGLTELNLPDSLEEINDEAFENCVNLRSVLIPANVTHLSSLAFLYCSNLQYISVDSGNTAYTTIGSVLYNSDRTRLVLYPPGRPGDCWIPDGVTEIGPDAFAYAEGLTDVRIPDSVEIIYGGAFEGCGLTSVRIPDSVSTICMRCFYNCRNLESIDLVTGLTTIERLAFYGCRKLASVVLPDGFTTLGEGAFTNCYFLREIYIPESAAFSEYDPSIFGGSDGVTIYGIRGSSAEAMANAAGLPFREGGRCGREVVWNLNEEGTVYIFGVGPMKDYTAGDPSPFCNDARILRVEFSPWVTGVGDRAFAGCSALLNINMPYLHGIEYFGEGAFQDCTGLRGVPMTSVTYIGPDAFSGCTNLGACYFADSDINIADQAFRDCPDLLFYVYPYTPAYWYAVNRDIPVILIIPFETPDYVTPHDLRIIEEEAFKGTPEEVIQLTDGVEKIGKRAFAECENLRKIAIPDSVTEIAPDAFDGCPEDMIIFGNAGTAAYTFAREKGFSFASWYVG